VDWHFQGTNDDREHTKRIIIEYLNRIKAGDDSAREEFILRFRPFILKLVYKATDRHVEPENSEEYSVALLAFNEASMLMMKRSILTSLFLRTGY